MQIEFGVIGALFGFLITYFGFMRNRDKDVKKEATESAVMSVNLDHIKTGVDSIVVDMKVRDKQFDEMSKEVVRIDESAKSAHKRIDKLDERG